MTKKELEQKVAELQKALEEEKQRPTGHSVTGCSFDMSNPDQTKIAIAEAVKEGMKALQSLGGDSVAISFGGIDR